MNTGNGPQTVFIVDDNPGMRVTLSTYLRAAGLTIETFDSAKAFLKTFCKTKPGCLILDIKMPQMSGLELQEYLLSIGANIPIIIVSGEAAVMDAVRAMKMGSFEFVEKPYEPDFLLQRVREALDFDRAGRIENERKSEMQTRYLQLTERERQILSFVISGKQSKIIADEMGVAVSTIDNHRANIMKKLKAETTADLTRIALIADPSLAFPFDR